MDTFEVGDNVLVGNRPEVGRITRVKVLPDEQTWYTVVWPSGVGSGALVLARVLSKA